MNKAVTVRAAGVAAVAAFLFLVARFWHPVYGFTAFLQLDAAQEASAIGPFHRLPVFVHPGTDGYDGQYYAQIACDPLLRSAELPAAIDNFSYRARRILVPALAWVFGGGRPALIVQVYPVLNIAAWLALASVCWRLLRVRDGASLLAWAAILFSAGALASVRFALSDLVALALLAWAMERAEAGRRGSPLGLAAAALARETSLAALPGFLTAPWISRLNLRRACLAAAPLLLWALYVQMKARSPGAPGPNFDWPLVRLAEKWRIGLADLRGPGDPLLAWSTVLATAGLTAQALYFARPRFSDPWWRLGAPFALMACFLGRAVWEGHPGAATRVLLPLTLAFSVMVCRRRSGVAWLLAGALTVPAGLLALRGLPSHPDEIAAGRRDGVAAVARAGPGWFGREESLRHTWRWSSGRGILEIETWPRTGRRIALDFSIRGLGDRTVVIRQGDRELWRARVSRAALPVEIAVAVEGGRARLDFSTDSPGLAEGPAAGGRSLAFAIYDARIRP